MKKIFFIILLLYSNISYAKKIGVFLYVSETEGDKIYNNFTKKLGFERKLSFGHLKNIEYHVTLGFIDNVDYKDAKELKQIIKDYFNQIKNVKFEFGITSLLGKSVPYIVALPKNPQIFKNLNFELAKILDDYKSAKYELSDFTRSNLYIPHLSLNAKLHDNVKLDQLTYILNELNKKMEDSVIVLKKIIVKIE